MRGNAPSVSWSATQPYSDQIVERDHVQRFSVQCFRPVVRGAKPDRHVDGGISGVVSKRSVAICQCGRTAAGGDRRTHDDRHGEGCSPWPDLLEPHHARLSGVRRLLRHGRNDRAHRRVLPARRAGSRRAQADPLSAGTGRRRQVLARRAAQVADGSPSDLCAEGRRRAQPGVREPARACSIRKRWGR